MKESIRHSLLVFLFYSFIFVLFFSPDLFNASLLAPGGGRLGDAVLYHLTFFQSWKALWDPLLSCGFPMMADPQVMAWYPPSSLLSFLPGAWNMFVMSAYVMSACFTYGYVYALTQSRVAGFASGLVYSMSGFMMAHLGHTAMIHVAAWLPLLIWSLEMLRRRFSRVWLAVAAIAIACCIFAGHLQIVSYCLVVAVLYAIVMGWNAPSGRRNYYVASVIVFVIGLGLTAVQLLPTAELANLSARSEYTFADFVSYSVPLKQMIALIFPAVFGGLQRYGTTPYFGEWNLAEMTGYVGLLPLMLAAIGFTATRRKAVSIFWLSIAVVALVLALGDHTPLARLVFHMPLLGKFRAPARHFAELAFAVSVLGGMGVKAVMTRAATKGLVLMTIAASSLVVLGGLVLLLTRHGKVFALPEGGTIRFNAYPWSNPAVAVPLIILIISCLALVWWNGRSDSTVRTIVLGLILVTDLGSFGWFSSWRQDAQPKAVINPPASVVHLAENLSAKGQRLLAVRGTSATLSEAPPNLSRLWNVSSAAVYSPLYPARLGELISMRPDGSVDPVWKQSTNQALNLAGVRYITVPRVPAARDAQGILWNADEMDFWLGNSRCVNPSSQSVRFDFGDPVNATTLGVVSRLACSTGMPDGAEAVRVTATDGAGNIEVQTVVSGRDSAEWAYDCPTVRPVMRHKRSSVFSNFPVRMNTDACEGHYYVTMLPFKKLRNIQHLEFSWAGQAEALQISKLTLINEVTRSYFPLDPVSARSNQWTMVDESNDARIYENSRMLPRAWLTAETVSLKRDEILTTIRTSRLPNGLPFDPTRTALLEDGGVAMRPEQRDLSAQAKVLRTTNTILEVETISEKPSFLVTSDIYYPGWRVYVDGAPAQLFVANYAFRGVKLPVGRHQVRFEYAPRRFYYGAGLSALSLFILTGLLLWPRLRKLARQPPQQFG